MGTTSSVEQQDNTLGGPSYWSDKKGEQCFSLSLFSLFKVCNYGCIGGVYAPVTEVSCSTPRCTVTVVEPAHVPPLLALLTFTV